MVAWVVEGSEDGWYVGCEGDKGSESVKWAAWLRVSSVSRLATMLQGYMTVTEAGLPDIDSSMSI